MKLIGRVSNKFGEEVSVWEVADGFMVHNHEHAVPRSCATLTMAWHMVDQNVEDLSDC